jgi:hypothetical protein
MRIINVLGWNRKALDGKDLDRWHGKYQAGHDW